MTKIPMHYWVIRGVLIAVVVGVTIATAVLVPWIEVLLALNAIVN